MKPRRHSDGDIKEETAKNTDREIWRLKPGDYYSPSIHVTENNAIGISVGGEVFVARVETWHGFAKCERGTNDLTMSEPPNKTETPPST